MFFLITKKFKMKKFMYSFILAALFFIPVMTLLAQGVTGADEDTAISSVYVTLFSLIATIPVATEALKKAFGVTKLTPNWIVQGLSWVVGLAFTLVGWYFELGFLRDVPIELAILYGFGASLVANGIADTKIIAGIFALFKK